MKCNTPNISIVINVFSSESYKNWIAVYQICLFLLSHILLFNRHSIGQIITIIIGSKEQTNLPDYEKKYRCTPQQKRIISYEILNEVLLFFWGS